VDGKYAGEHPALNGHQSFDEEQSLHEMPSTQTERAALSGIPNYENSNESMTMRPTEILTAALLCALQPTVTTIVVDVTRRVTPR
jgi:hypothetical protein